eukprot:gnl/TRDRNA2_/TRDRNA2_83455_c0_seq1.p1 gnl/TRDRNA2_/TRDRNA2_83455_c0~~gnl/TRDRNA2_/TRDRNA2_83455_c0_seq1.p1  ORF type:complete len:372 (-),score=75.30 gnl/TRDRNA2_/TRDRNA2_83455_c0_seq1:45-1160(-)
MRAQTGGNVMHSLVLIVIVFACIAQVHAAPGIVPVKAGASCSRLLSCARPTSRRSLRTHASGADCPSIIVGGGRIGSMLASLGGDGDAVMKRGDPFPSSPETGPIYVTTRNNDLAGVIETTPEHRRKDLVFMQNGMLGKFLEDQRLAGNTQVLLYLAVAKLGEPPIDGITDLAPDGLTAAKGEWAAAFADRLGKGGLKCNLLDGKGYDGAMLEKHMWICSFMMVGALNGGVTVGDVESKHAEQLKPLVDEMCAAGEEALGVKLPEGVYDRLAAYGRSVAHFPTAVKEFEWRNGWFYDISKAAIAAGKPDPMPLHTAGLQKLGVIPEAEMVQRASPDIGSVAAVMLFGLVVCGWFRFGRRAATSRDELLLAA